MSSNEPTAKFPAVPGRATMPAWYPELLDSVTDRISVGHRRAVQAANTELLATYWAIGRDILDRQESEGWGAKVVDRLASDLKERFPDLRGFSPRNLKYMRALAIAWSEDAIVQAPLAQLPWYHHLALLAKLDDPHRRLWYADQAITEGWSRDILALQIDTRLHEREGRAISNFAATLPAPDSDLAPQATKDPYVFDFLTSTDTANERATENGLMRHIRKFLLELGQGFAFVGQQVRLEINDDEFYCDLLFYHFKLRRCVVIELKAVKFQPEFVGKIGMYMAAVDELLAAPDETPTIGLILCKTKNNAVAEFAVRSNTSPVGISEWANDITNDLPPELAATLPTIEELEAELAAKPWEEVQA